MKRIVLYISCIILAVAGMGQHTAQASDRHHVLVIHSYHKGFTWTDHIDITLRQTLASHSGIEVSSEYLDSKRLTLARAAIPFLGFLEEKYASRRPDIVILTDNNALEFTASHYDRLFRGIPVVFCGINKFHPKMVRKFGPNVTGVVEKTDPLGTIRLIRKLQPDLNRLVIVSGTTPTAGAIRKETQIALAGIEKNMNLVWQDGLSSQKLLTYLGILSPDDAVLLISFNRDRDNRYYTHEKSAAMISSRTAAPVYGLWDFYLNSGLIGGKMVSSRDQGTLAGKKCLAILKTGEIPPIRHTSPNAILIDYAAFSAHGLKASNLPPNAIIVNKPTSFYQTHKLLIWSVCGFITILVLLILALAANIVSRKESDQKYRTLFEDALDAHFLMAPDLRILDCNPAALKLFNLASKEAFIGLTPDAISPAVQPGGLSSTKAAEKMAAITLKKGRHIFEWRHKRINKETFDASVLLCRTTIGGKPVIHAAVRDISDQKQAQELMIQSEKMMSVGGLAAGMAHEINNPLAAMIQSASVLSNRITRLDMPANLTAAKAAGTSMSTIARYMQDRKITQMTAAIIESGNRIATIVDNMLSFARKGGSRLSSHHPAELLDQVLNLAATDFDLKKHYDFKNIRIKKTYEADLPMVICEGSKIQQVLLNILKNGAQAMADPAKDTAPTFTIRLAHETVANMLRIEIQDNGPGMDSKTRQRIFEPFFTTKPSGQGTGLGLSVSYFIVTDNHRGTMTVTSRPGQGTTFVIRLPLTPPARV
jgi:PAS domain S-box-containing protein